MLKKSIVLFAFIAMSVHICQSQTLQNLKDINTVWDKFCKGYNTLDYKLMGEVHSKQLIRIAGGNTFFDYDTYIGNYQKQFETYKINNTTNAISLRFFERINTDTIASERGIYKVIRNKGKSYEQTFYGQFHVIMKKENGAWIITMDYDSNENNTIDEGSYQKAHAIDDFDTFVKQ